MATDTPGAAGEAARKAFWRITVGQTSDQMLDRALAVFEPLIRAEEREACARLTERANLVIPDGGAPIYWTLDGRAYATVADLIRASKDTTDGH